MENLGLLGSEFPVLFPGFIHWLVFPDLQCLFLPEKSGFNRKR